MAAIAVLVVASSWTAGAVEGSTSPAPTPTVRSVTASPTTQAVGIPGCPHPPSLSHPSHRFLVEVRGSAEHGKLWALIFQKPGDPVRAGKQVKIVWRMTGRGSLSLVAVDGTGIQVGPDVIGAHGGSTWDRPGDEWGSLFTFPEPGCWDIHAERTSVAGDVWLAVE
jgi:hypothetical protein